MQLLGSSCECLHHFTALVSCSPSLSSSPCPPAPVLQPLAVLIISTNNQLSVLQFTFGYGVGGEYPMAAGSAAERAEAKGRASARKRGREVVMTFSMQGLGNFSNTAVLCILLAVYSQTEPNKKTHVYTPWKYVCCSLCMLCALILAACVIHVKTCAITVAFEIFWQHV